MKKTLSALIVGAAAGGALPGPGRPWRRHCRQVFQRDQPDPDAQERAAIAIAKRWERGRGDRHEAGRRCRRRHQVPVRRRSNRALFARCFRCATWPCSPANKSTRSTWATQPGGRWSRPSPAAAPTEVQHLIIKPMDVGLETSLIVTTNRRSYHFRLRSHRTEYMPQVSFTYPEEAQAKWDAIQRRESRSAPTTPCPRPASTWAISRSTMSCPGRRAGSRCASTTMAARPSSKCPARWSKPKRRRSWSCAKRAVCSPTRKR